MPKFSLIELQWKKIFEFHKLGFILFTRFGYSNKTFGICQSFHRWNYNRRRYLSFVYFRFFLSNLFWYFDHLTFDEIYFSKITMSEVFLFFDSTYLFWSLLLSIEFCTLHNLNFFIYSILIFWQNIWHLIKCSWLKL